MDVLQHQHNLKSIEVKENFITDYFISFIYLFIYLFCKAITNDWRIDNFNLYNLYSVWCKCICQCLFYVDTLCSKQGLYHWTPTSLPYNMKMQLCDCTLLKYCNISVLYCYRFFIEVNIVWMRRLFPWYSCQCVAVSSPCSVAEFTSLQKELEQRDSQRDDLVLQLKVSYLNVPQNLTCNPSTKCRAGPSWLSLLKKFNEVLYLFRSSQCSTTGVTRERNVLFNNALNTFYLRLYGIRHMVKDHSDSERGNPLGYSFWLTARVLLYAPSHRQDNTYHGLCYTSCGALAGTRNSSMGPPNEGSIRWPIAPLANALTTELHLAPLKVSNLNVPQNLTCNPSTKCSAGQSWQRCQPGTTPIYKIMTKNPYNLQNKSLQIVNIIAKHNFGIGSRCNTHIQ